jgi:hypothetical protein
MSTEADARILIDKMLEKAGWCITNKAQVSTEEAAADGRADYLLKDTRSRPLAVLEAKRFTVDPYLIQNPYSSSCRAAPDCGADRGADQPCRRGTETNSGSRKPITSIPSIPSRQGFSR